MALTLEELRSLVDAGKVGASGFSLPLVSLQSPSVSVLAKYLAGGSLQLSTYEVGQSDAASTVTVTGTASSGCFAGLAVTATFGIAAEQATANITVSGSEGWGFVNVFPVLASSPIAGVRFSACTLSVSSEASASTPAGMATFSGTLAASSFLGPLASLFSVKAPVLTGVLDVVEGTPFLSLATAAVPIDLGFSNPPTLSFEVHAEPITIPGTPPDMVVFLQFRASLPFSVKGRQYVLPIFAYVADSATVLSFVVDLPMFTDLVEAALDDLVELTPGAAVGASVPAPAGLHLDDLVTLSDVGIQINPAAPNKLVSVSLEVINKGSWVILPPSTPGGGLAVDSLTLRINVDMTTKRPSFTLIADIDVGLGALLQLSASAPDFTVSGGLQPGTAVKLSDVITRFAPAEVSSLPNLEIAGLEFSAQPGVAYSLDVDVDGSWPIPLGFVDLSIDDLHLTADYASGTGVTGSLSGTFTIEGVDVELSAAHPGSGDWVFTTSAAAQSPVDLKAVIGRLLPERIPLPSEFSELQVRNLTVSWDTGAARRLTVTGETDIVVAIGPRSLTMTAGLSIDSALASSGQRTTTGTLSGTLVLDGMSFAASYAFRSDTQILTATWSGQGAGFAALAQAFVVTGPPLEVRLPDLELRTASFELDWSKTGEQSVTFEATTAFGAAFFTLARPRPQAPWGFVFGAALEGTDRLSQLFSQIGLDAPGLDFVRLDAALFLVASAQFTQFQAGGFPGLGTSPMLVNPGVSAAVVLDLGNSASRPDVNVLKALTANQPATLLAEVTLGTNPAALVVAAELAGGVTLKGAGTSSLTLSNAAFVLTVDPLALSLRGSLEVPLGQVSMQATGQLTVSETGGISASFNIEGQNGAVLPFPMGFKGVHLLDLGVELGVAVEPPSVELGFEGKFVIGEPNPQSTGQAVAPRALSAMPPPNEFVMIVGLDGDIPNPVLLSMFLQELSVGKAIEAFTDQPTAGLPDVLGGIRVSDLMIYWCDAPAGVQQPDGTWAYPGFGFNGTLDLVGFHAHADLKIDQKNGISGDACIDPVHIHGVLDLTGTGQGTPPTYQGQDTVLPGGPFVHVSTATSPYLAVNWDVVLFNTVSDTLNLQVTSSGFTFETAYKVNQVFSSNLQCSLTSRTHFELAFSFALTLDVPIGAIAGVDLGPIHLNTSLEGKVVVDVSGAFRLTVDGSFESEGDRYTMPTISVSAPFASLEQITKAVDDQIRNEASTIFKDMIDRATQIIQQSNDVVNHIKGSLSEEVAQLTQQTDQQVNQTLSDARHTAAQTKQSVDQAAADKIAQADQLFQRAQRDANSGLAGLHTTLTNVQQVAATTASEASTIGPQSVNQVASGLHAVVNDAGNAINQAGNDIRNNWNQFTSLFPKLPH